MRIQIVSDLHLEFSDINIKNTNNAATSKVNPFTGATIDGSANITLSHNASGLNGGIMIQARTTSLWSILSHTGSISS
jgi:hypothetical protein